MTIQAVIHRAELPIDDHPHGIDLAGDLLHAAARRPGYVDVWYLARRDQHMAHMRRSFQIVADGQPFPPHLAEHQVSAITPDGMIAWHVLENHCPHTTRPDGVPERVPGLCDGCGVRLTRHPSWGWIPA